MPRKQIPQGLSDLLLIMTRKEASKVEMSLNPLASKSAPSRDSRKVPKFIS